MEYIKQLFSSNSMLGYGAGFILLILVIGIVFFFIRRKNLNNQNIGLVLASNNIGGLAAANITQGSGMGDVLMQGGMAPNLNKDPTLNTLMNSEEILNNSFVISAEENAAKRMSNLANNTNGTDTTIPTNTATASNVHTTSEQAL